MAGGDNSFTVLKDSSPIQLEARHVCIFIFLRVAHFDGRLLSKVQTGKSIFGQRLMPGIVTGSTFL